MKTSRNITIIGTGYVGLVSGCCLAALGHHVTCVDIDAEKINQLQQGIPTIYEKGLESLLKESLASGQISFTTDVSECVAGSDAVFLCVGTPPCDDGSADLVHLKRAFADVIPYLHGYTVIVNKSTVPPETTRDMADYLYQLMPDLHTDIVSNPEFLREGNAIHDFMQAERIVVGCDTEQSRIMMESIYAPLVERHNIPVVYTNSVSAELTKYAANGLLATKVCFVNELANLAENLGANINDITTGIGLDSRIGSQFLNPGPGVGGSCFPKDSKALAYIGNRYNTPMRVMEAVSQGNNLRPLHMAEKIRKILGNNITGKRIAILGLAFKANTDDVRESPAIYIANALAKMGAHIVTYDPQASDNAAPYLERNVDIAGNAYAAAHNADAIVIATEWSEFRSLNLNKIADLMNDRLMIDLRNIFTPDDMQCTTWTYHSIGRQTALPHVSAQLDAIKNTLLRQENNLTSNAQSY